MMPLISQWRVRVRVERRWSRFSYLDLSQALPFESVWDAYLWLCSFPVCVSHQAVTAAQGGRTLHLSVRYRADEVTLVSPVNHMSIFSAVLRSLLYHVPV